MTQSLKELPNIGTNLANRLEAVGINTYKQLVEVGSVEAVIRMNDSLNQGCYNCLYALEGAIKGVRWHLLSPGKKKALKNELDTRYDNQK